MSGRKRKSLWDSKEETEIPAEFGKNDARHGREIHSSHHAKWSELEAKNALNSNNGSRWSSEIRQDNNGRRDYNELPRTERTAGGAKGYSRSPGLNERGKQNHSPPEIYWSQSRRCQRSRSSSRSKGRAGSRSRSRDRDREMDKDTDSIRNWSSGRDRNMDKDTHGIHSWSRGRDREMDKDTDDIRGRGRDRDTNDIRSWNRGRDRDMDRDMDGIPSWSRGRDRDMDKDRDTNWSRSSLSDQRREHNGMGDVKNGARASSQICRDFSVGMCRRGDQCRFLHEDNLNLRDEFKPERERADRSRGRQETSETFSSDNERLRYRTLDKVSNYDRSNRSSFDRDHRRQPHKNSNIPCKYFAMGRCHRDDCRFSHDHPGGGDVKERVQYDRYTQHPDDENKYRHGPKWGDANGVSDMNINDWNDRDTGKMSYTDRTPKRQAYGRLDQDIEDENISWNGPKWSDGTGMSDVARPNLWDDSNAGSVNVPETPRAGIKTDERCGNSMDHMMWSRTQNNSNMENADTFESTLDREVWVDAQGSHIQTADGTSLQSCEKIIEGASTQKLSNNVGHPLVSEISCVQQPDSNRGNNIMLNDNCNALKGVSISGNSKQLLVPEHIFNQNSGTSVSVPFNFHETDQMNVIPVSLSKGPETDPNRSDVQLLYPNQQDDSKKLFEEFTNKQQMLESEVCKVDPVIPQNVMTSHQVAAIPNLSASLNEIFSNGKQLPELYAVLNSKNSTSLSCSASVNPPTALTVNQPSQMTKFQGQHVPIGDTIEPGKHGKIDEPSEQENHASDKLYEENKPTPFEHPTHSSTETISEGDNNNKHYDLGEPKPLDQFLLSSTDGPDSGKTEKVCSPVKPSQVSPTVKLSRPNINLEAHQNLKSENCKPEEDIPSDNANPEGRVREGNTGKDEKEMRLFKVALVEFVKEILKPTWKEGQMSREVHKSIVKKVVDKVTGTIQAVHVPKTQEKVDQYLASSKPKLAKLVQAYTERLLKS
ncbi:uncharacterized protein LOC141719243 [Apium graveolens]|uniref:uncharacterized protein LOC141719243 n=1 Tax=Apium graveolens TaxID=4045 RepID=UPI003D7B9BFC